MQTKPRTGPHLPSVLDELNDWLVVRRSPTLAAIALASLSTDELEVAWLEVEATPVGLDNAAQAHGRLLKEMRRLVRELADGPGILVNGHAIEAFDQVVALARSTALASLLSTRDLQAELDAQHRIASQERAARAQPSTDDAVKPVVGAGADA